MDCTQNQLAEILRVTQDSISLWENDKRMPDTQYIVAMAKFFDVTTDYLLGLTEEYENIRFGKALNALQISSDEITLLKRYRTMSDKEKKLLKQYVELLK